jgi:hypothetical protein
MRLDQQIAELAQVSLEEVFHNDPHARAEYEAQCDIWRDEAIAAQDEEVSNGSIGRTICPPFPRATRPPSASQIRLFLWPCAVPL